MARPGLLNHPKFRTYCRLLGEPRPHALGYLELLWAAAYECGDPAIGDGQAVEATAEYPGVPGKLVEALCECGGDDRAGLIEVIEDRPGKYQVHDLFDHAPRYVYDRAEREAQRRVKGLTLTDVRRAAGQRGGVASGAARREAGAKQTGSKSKQIEPLASSNGAHRSKIEAKPKRGATVQQNEANRSKHEANGATPAPCNTTYYRAESAAPPSARTDSAPDFDAFWDAYPKRNGRRAGKQSCLKLWRQLKADERALVVKAAGNYAASQAARDGFARDPERFLKASWWRDWIESAGASEAQRVPSAADLAAWNPTGGCAR